MLFSTTNGLIKYNLSVKLASSTSSFLKVAILLISCI